jgi:hypothetical protein
MGWFKRLRNNLIRVNASLSFGVDANGDEIAIGRSSDLTLDPNFNDGSASAYGIGSIAFHTDGVHIVDADGLWQKVTATTASLSLSPSHSASPSASVSPSHSGSPSASGSPSGSASLSLSPSASGSPSASASPSV